MKKAVLINLVALLFLSACNSPFTKEAAPAPEAEPVVMDDVMTEKEVVAEEDINDVEEHLVSRYGSSMKCTMLKEKSNQELCEQQTNDLIGTLLESEIVDRFDVNRCDELPTEPAEACKSTLTATGVVGPVPDEELALFSEIMLGSLPETEPEEGEDGVGEALMPEYDSTRCAELKTSGYKEYCESEIAERLEQIRLMEVIESGTVQECEEFSNEALMLDCKSAFGLEGEI